MPLLRPAVSSFYLRGANPVPKARRPLLAAAVAAAGERGPWRGTPLAGEMSAWMQASYQERYPIQKATDPESYRSVLRSAGVGFVYNAH